MADVSLITLCSSFSLLVITLDHYSVYVYGMDEAVACDAGCLELEGTFA